MKYCFYLTILSFLSIQVLADAKADFYIVTVNKEDSFYSLSNEHLNHFRYWRDLLEFNGLSHPPKIYPGQEIHIPYYLSKKRIASIEKFYGYAKQQSGGNIIYLEDNKALKLVESSSIEIGSDSKAEILLDSGSSLTLIDESNLSFDQFQKADNSRICRVNILFGTVELNIPDTIKEELELKINSYTLAMTKGKLRVKVYANGDVKIAVYSGTAYFIHKDKVTEIYTGFGFGLKKNGVANSFQLPNKIDIQSTSFSKGN